MKKFKPVFAVILATIWISISEFVRNEFILKSYWTEHYQNLGLTFPSEPINGAIWGIWSLFFAIGIFLIAKKFSLWHTTFISWWMGFVLMWVVTGNMAVLPFDILPFAIPLSLLEAFLASLIIKKLS
ncbi:MAG TPA: hypothetical protein P5514_13500 [Bacteroidales bacterium]|nr:hypothetical protein [Bacteroidales bacterium]HPE56264.1 hypothetical protein [Bacteroidales bacterium]HRX97958.1 hypothetical protein [Bacteroidales bacterium]